MNQDQDRTRPYDDAKNITIGLGRIFWSDYTIDSNGKAHDAGWVLPGGGRTTNELAARDWAARINIERQSKINLATA